MSQIDRLIDSSSVPAVQLFMKPTKLFKIFKYKIGKTNEAEFFEIQKAADKIYRKHLDYHVYHLRSHLDSEEWLEIQVFSSKQDLELAENLHNKEPQLSELFSKFETILEEFPSPLSESVYDYFPVRNEMLIG